MRASAWLVRARSSAPLALLLLLLANLLPLVGVLFLGWDVFTLLLLYWVENGIVGVLNLIKIRLAAGAPDAQSRGGLRISLPAGAQKAYLIPFFAFHYGLFWVVHGVFVFIFAGIAGAGIGGAGSSLAPEALLLGGLALLLSHGGSLYFNFLGRGEYRRTSPQAQFAQPYARMIVLHLTIVAGGTLIMGLGQPLLLMVLMVVLKTALDVILHLREHAALRDPAPAA